MIILIDRHKKGMHLIDYRYFNQHLCPFIQLSIKSLRFEHHLLLSQIKIFSAIDGISIILQLRKIHLFLSKKTKKKKNQHLISPKITFNYCGALRENCNFESIDFLSSFTPFIQNSLQSYRTHKRFLLKNKYSNKYNRFFIIICTNQHLKNTMYF